MASSEELVPLLDPPSHLNRVNTENTKKRKYRGIQLLVVCYSLLLCWQLAGSCLFVMRCVTCFRNETLTYQCDNNVPFRYSGELELTWLVTQCLHGVLLIVALHKVPAFPGYKAALYQLKFLPSFWTLILLFLVALSRFVILSLSSEFLMQMMTVVAFSFTYFVKVLMVGFLNYTQLNLLKRHYPKFVFVLCKLTLLVIVIECFVIFIMSFISMLIDRHVVKADEFSVFVKTSEILRQVSVVFFRLKIMSFFWQKLFIDNKNILSANFELLPCRQFVR